MAAAAIDPSRGESAESDIATIRSTVNLQVNLMDNAKDLVSGILAEIDVRIGGTRPWDIQVHNEDFYRRIISQGTLGLGESYMDRWWDCEAVDELISRVLQNDLARYVKTDWSVIRLFLGERLFNRQAHGRRADKIGKAHYDTGNDLFTAMLDKRMTYSCAYWDGASDLDEAQENKLDLVCRKLMLEPGMRVLDIGCGWGSFAKFAAEKYGVNVLGINNSKEQVKLGSELCEGLPVEIRFQDYRDVTGTFDRVVSIGMFEHVGPRNHRTFIELVKSRMVDDGLCLLHTIGVGIARKKPDTWTEKYIFPAGVLPSVLQIAEAMDGIMVMEDWQNIGVHYEKTLMAWKDNFEEAWPTLEENYGDRFYRMWRFFLLMSAGSFRARANQVWQVVMSKRGILGGYKSVR